MILEAKVQLRCQETGHESRCTMRDAEGIEVGDVHLMDVPGQPRQHWTVERILKELVVTEVHRAQHTGEQ